MWTKHSRFIVFNLIYNQLYYERNLLGKPQMQELYDMTVSTIVNPEGIASYTDVSKRVKMFNDNKEDYTVSLLEYLNKWENTYDIVKAVFYTFLIEKNEVEDLSKVIGKYIRLTQEMIGGESTSLVHAVLSKLAEK